MKLEKINEIVVDTDICNSETEEKNKKFLVENCFEVTISENDKHLKLKECLLMFHVNIEAILEHTNIDKINVLINQKGKARASLLCIDKDGNKLKEYIKVKCPKCGREFETQRGHLMRRTHLLCKNCCYSFTQLHGGMKKFEQTMIEKYGCRRPIQNTEIKKKTQKTMRERYGANSPLESNIVQKKIINTMLERYGVENPFFSSQFQYQCKKKYINHSVKGDELMERLSKDLPFSLLFGDNEKIFTFKNRWRRVDGYIEEKAFAIEFQGNYYHANPEIYDENYVFNMWGKTFIAKEVWDKDKKRKEELESSYHIKVFYIWEKEYDEKGYDFILAKVKKELGI